MPHFATHMHAEQRLFLGGGNKPDLRWPAKPLLATVAHIRSMVVPREKPPPAVLDGMEDAGMGALQACDPVFTSVKN